VTERERVAVMCVPQGVLCRTLQGHGHWVNTMALSTGYTLRTGAYDPADADVGLVGVQGLSRECAGCTLLCVVSVCGTW
jgi:hypothetical protein